MLVEMDFFFSHTVRCTLQHGAAWAWSHFFYYKAQGLQRPDNWCPVNLRIVWHGHMYRYILYTGGRSRVWFGGGRLRWKDLAKHQRDLSAIRAAFSLFIRFAARSAIILHDDDDANGNDITIVAFINRHLAASAIWFWDQIGWNTQRWTRADAYFFPVWIMRFLRARCHQPIAIWAFNGSQHRQHTR